MASPVSGAERRRPAGSLGRTAVESAAHPGAARALDRGAAGKRLGRIRGVGHRITGDRRTRVRGIGWEHVHVFIDDASRLAYAEVLTTPAWPDAVGSSNAPSRGFAAHDIHAQRVMTDNGSAYLPRFCGRVSAPRPAPPPDPRLHPAHQR
jgi:hypothetical protein